MKPLRIICTLLTLSFFIVSCKPSIAPADLYGKWKYIKVEQPYAHPPDSVSSTDLAYQKPYIRFSTDNTLLIMWDGKVLSHGKFVTKGRNIIYTETLPDGTTRTFPFWVSELTDNRIIFETKGEDGSRVTAVKAN
jgi:hypothetical protein